eukprot:g55577.t1
MVLICSDSRLVWSKKVELIPACSSITTFPKSSLVSVRAFEGFDGEVLMWHPRLPRLGALRANFQASLAEVFCFFPGMLFTPRIMRVIYFFLAFTQEFPVTALGMMLVLELQLPTTQVIAYYMLSYLPWTLRSLNALVTDCCPIRGLRRKPYLIIGGLGACGCYFLQATAGSFGQMLALGMSLSIFQVFSEVVMDSMAVEIANSYNTADGSDAAGRGGERREGAAEGGEEGAGQATQATQAASGQAEMQQALLVDAPGHPVPTSENEADEKANERAEPAAQTSAAPVSAAVSRQEAQARVQSESMAAKSFGSVVAAALQILAMAYMKPRSVLALVAIFPLLTAGLALRVREEVRYGGVCACCLGGARDGRRVSPGGALPMAASRAGRATLWRQYCQRLKPFATLIRTVAVPLIFIFLYSAAPTTIDVYPYFLYHEFSTAPAWIFSVQVLTGLIGALLGSLFYWRFFSTTYLPAMFFFGTILGLGSALCQLGVVFHASVFPRLSLGWLLGLAALLSNFLSRIGATPAFILAARCCPNGAEASVFSLFTGVAHLGSLLSGAFSLLVAKELHISSDDFSRLWRMVVICAATNLLPLLALPFLARALPAADRQLHVFEKDAVSSPSPAVAPSAELAESALTSQPPLQVNDSDMLSPIDL